MPDHAKEYYFNVIEFTIRANESCFEEFEYMPRDVNESLET